MTTAHSPLPAPEVAALLRHAFAARADTVTEENLMRGYSAPIDPDPPTTDVDVRRLSDRPARRSGWLGPLAAAAAVVVVIGAAVGIGLGGRGTTPEPTAPAAPTGVTQPPPTGSVTTAPNPSLGPPPPASPVAVAVTARELPAAQIPWASVGVGWAVSMLGLDAGGSSARVYLLAPDGARHSVATLTGSPRLLAVTADARRALVMQQPSGQSAGVGELDLTTGAFRRFLTGQPGTEIEAGYADSLGTGVLVTAYRDTAAGGVETTLERWSTDGRRTAEVLRTPGRAMVLPSGDGSRLLVGAPGRLGYVAADGTAQLTITPPIGLSSCRPVRWFDDTRAVLACRPDEGSDLAVQFAVDSNGVLSQLTPNVTQPPVPSGGEIDWVAGQWQGWARSGGTVLATRGNGCERGTYAVSGGSSTSRIGAVTGAPDNGQAIVVAVEGSTVYAVVGCVESLHSVALLDAATLSPTLILGAPVQTPGDVLALRVALAAPLAVGFPTYR